MKARVSILLSAFVIFGIVIGFLSLVASRRTPYLSSPDDAREWARESYEEMFSPTGRRLPYLNDSPVPRVTIDRKASELTVKAEKSASDESRIHFFGDAVEAAAGTNYITLPNGQKIELLAVALVKLSEKEKKGKQTVEWKEPLSLASIEDPVSAELPETHYMSDLGSEFIVALKASGNDPVHWNWPQIRDGNTLARVTGGSSSFTRDGVFCVAFDLLIYHTTPIDLLVPVAWGTPEKFRVSSMDAGVKRQIHGDRIHVEFFAAQNGYQHSSSYSGGDTSIEQTWRWEEPDGKWDYRSFLLFHVWPPVHGKLLQYRIDGKDRRGNEHRWSSFHSNEGFAALRHYTELETTPQLTVRYFPESTRAIFRIPGIPDLPKSENLFSVELPAMEIKYENAYRSVISDATGMRWLANAPIPSHQFPFELEAGSTPAELLADYSARAGVALYVDPTFHEITTKQKAGFWQIAKDWFMDFRSKIFP